MRFRTLGKTGLNVSILSYGASPLGGVFGAVDEPKGIQTVHAAIDLGINFIDVSPYYGITKAETVLGKALQEISRERFFLATKVGRYGVDLFDFSAERVVKSIEESLVRLKVDYIDLIQCHDIEFTLIDQLVQETLPTLYRLKEQGKVGHVGITGLPLKAFIKVLEQTEIDTILSYCRYSLNDTSLESVIPYLKSRGVGIISASPLSMGLLTQQGPPSWHPASAEIKEACLKAATYCRQQGVDIAQLAMQFALSNSDICTTLVGTANVENLKKNIAWIEFPIDSELLDQIQNILKPVSNKTWISGRPENN